MSSSRVFRRQDIPSECGSPLNTNTINIIVHPAIEPGLIGHDNTICYGDGVSLENLESPDGSDGNFEYTWQRSTNGTSFSDIPESNNPVFATDALTQTTYFRRKVISGPDIDYSNSVKITVREPLDPGSIASNQTLCYNSTPAQLIGTTPTGGDGIYTYQWQSSSNGTTYSNIGSATHTDYQPGPLQSTMLLRRQVTSGSGCGVKYSNPVTITVRDDLDPGIIGSEQTICPGTSPNQITGGLPTGGNGIFSYQWQERQGNDWVNIYGATSLGYFPGDLNQSRQYRRMVTSGGGCGSKPTNTVLISVYDDMKPGEIASNQTICFGEMPDQLNGSAASGADGVFTYQWQGSDNGSNWINLPLASDQNYLPGNLENTTYYRRQSTSVAGCGSMNSNIVTINVLDDLNPGSISSSQTICYDGQPILISGTMPTGSDQNFEYQWQMSENGSTYSDISNATHPDFQPGNLLKTTYFRREVSSGCGLKNTNSITIDVLDDLLPGTIAQDQEICYNTNPVRLSGSNPLGGGGSYSYQWQESSNGINWVNIINANDPDFAPNNLQQSVFYRRMVTSDGGCGSDATNSVLISVLENIKPGSIMGNQQLCYGETAEQLEGTQATGGNGNFSYQWEQSVNGIDWTNVALATELNYLPNQLIESAYFRRLATSSMGCGTEYSNVVSIEVFDAFVSDSITDNQSICFHEQPRILTGEIPKGGGGAYIFQWQYSLDGNTFEDIEAANNESYQPNILDETAYFRRGVSATCGSLISNAIKIEVYDTIIPGSIMGSQIICFDTEPNVILGSPATGGDRNMTYSWLSSGNGQTWNEVPSAFSMDYQPPKMSQHQYYKRRVGNICGTKETDSILIEVKEKLNPGHIGPEQTICYGEIPLKLSGDLATGGYGNMAYQWQYSTNGTAWNDIVGKTSWDYVPEELISSTFYRRKAIDQKCGETTTNTILVNVKDQVPSPVFEYKDIYCKGEDIYLSQGSSDKIVLWLDDNDSLLHTGPNYLVQDIQESMNLACYAQSPEGCLSRAVNLELLVDNVKALFEIEMDTINIGQTVQFINQSLGAVQYLWNFSEGMPSEEKNPWHVFNDGGQKSISLTAISGNQCSDSIRVDDGLFVYNATSVDVNWEKHLLIYPNPAKDKITLQFRDNKKKHISIFDMNGTKILDCVCNGIQDINISKLTPGIYSIVVMVPSGKAAYKFVKYE